jgi:hypothetical protein
MVRGTDESTLSWINMLVAAAEVFSWGTPSRTSESLLKQNYFISQKSLPAQLTRKGHHCALIAPKIIQASIFFSAQLTQKGHHCTNCCIHDHSGFNFLTNKDGF